MNSFVFNSWSKKHKQSKDVSGLASLTLAKNPKRAIILTALLIFKLLVKFQASSVSVTECYPVFRPTGPKPWIRVLHAHR